MSQQLKILVYQGMAMHCDLVTAVTLPCTQRRLGLSAWKI